MAIHGDLTVFNAVKYITLPRRILGSSRFAVISVVTLSTLTPTKRFVVSVTPFAVNVLVVMEVILPPKGFVAREGQLICMGMDVSRGEGTNVDMSWLYWTLCTTKVLV